MFTNITRKLTFLHLGNKQQFKRQKYILRQTN